MGGCLVAIAVAAAIASTSTGPAAQAPLRSASQAPSTAPQPPPVAAPITPTVSPMPTPSAGPPGSITILGVAGQYWRTKRIQATFTGGDVVYDLDGADTLAVDPGVIELTLWNRLCDFFNPCGGAPVMKVKVICKTTFILQSGQALQLRIDIEKQDCVRHIGPMPDPPAHPASITGQLRSGRHSCLYLRDDEGLAWDLTLPAGYVTGLPKHVYDVMNGDGETIAEVGDRVQVKGTRIGAHATGCAKYRSGDQGIGYQVARIVFISHPG